MAVADFAFHCLTVSSRTPCTFAWTTWSIVELDVAAVLRLGQLQLLERLAVRRVDLQLTARLAGQPRVERVFQPGAVGPAVQVDVGVAEQLRGQVAERVDAVCLGYREQAGRVGRQDVVDGRRVELAHQLHLVGVGFEQPAQPGDLGAPVLRALDAKPVGDIRGGDVGVDYLLRVHHQRLPGHLLGQLVAIPVGDRAPRHGDVVDVALLRVGPADELARVDRLDLDRPSDDQREADHRQDHDQAQAAIGQVIHGRAGEWCTDVPAGGFSG